MQLWPLQTVFGKLVNVDLWSGRFVLYAVSRFLLFISALQELIIWVKEEGLKPVPTNDKVWNLKEQKLARHYFIHG